MPLALAFLTIGVILAASGLTGKSVADLLAEGIGDAFNPAGGRGGTVDTSTALTDTAAAGDALDDLTVNTAGDFYGPNAVILNRLKRTAETRFRLDVKTCRSRSRNAAVGGSATSNHLENSQGKCKAFDASGSARDMRAFAMYVNREHPDLELFYDPIGKVAPGFDHTDHVHVGSDL